MLEAAMENPVAFGRAHAGEITSLIDLADLQLSEFTKIEAKLASALDSKDPWQRYWACIVASAHGADATTLKAKITDLAATDVEPLVRCRAAECLGLTGSGEPRPGIMSALKLSKSPVATNLILNSATLLQNSSPSYKFDIKPSDVSQRNGLVDARLAYLSGAPAPPKGKKAGAGKRKKNP